MRPELADYLREQDRGVLRAMMRAAADPATCTQNENQLARHLSYFVEAADELLKESVRLTESLRAFDGVAATAERWGHERNVALAELGQVKELNARLKPVVEMACAFIQAHRTSEAIAQDVEEHGWNPGREEEAAAAGKAFDELVDALDTAVARYRTDLLKGNPQQDQRSPIERLTASALHEHLPLRGGGAAGPPSPEPSSAEPGGGRDGGPIAGATGAQSPEHPALARLEVAASVIERLGDALGGTAAGAAHQEATEIRSFLLGWRAR